MNDTHDLLTVESAEQYVRDYFAKCEEPRTIEILQSMEGGLHNDEYDMIDVEFCMEGRVYTFSVWIEGGKLYGEW